MYDPELVKGFDKLTKNAEMFKQFLINFHNAWEHPEEHTPVKAAFTKDESNGAYLRVDCIRKGEWYHVKGPHTWY
jgi:hypothetical protein